MGSPILERAVAYIREDTALDVEVHEEGGRFFLTVDGLTLGPMDHGQTWWALMAVGMGHRAWPTLDTEKTRETSRRQAVVDAALAKHKEGTDG